MTLTREQLLQPLPVRTEAVPMPEFGPDATVFVHGMTARERSAFERQFLTKTGQQNARRVTEYRERLIVQCVRDEHGAALFTETDVAAIGNQPASVVERMVDASLRVCGMKSGDIEELAGNSDETTGDDLPSG